MMVLTRLSELAPEILDWCVSCSKYVRHANGYFGNSSAMQCQRCHRVTLT